MYNLLKEKWIPVRLEGGTSDWIAPYQIGDPGVLGVNPGRPDFKAALMELLVGLLQTTFAPPAPDWRKWLEKPPLPEELQKAFAPHEPYFELLGDGLRFMQDLTMCDADKPARSDASSLLIEQPGEQTLKNNVDLFIHRGQVKSLCPACAATALYTLQAFSPSGGRGIRTSLRGGGPLSTLICGSNLWQSIWLNVLPCGTRSGEMPETPQGDELKGKVYPWAAPTRTSAKNEETHLEDVHMLHAYWAMPRRLRLEESESAGPCDICGCQHELAVTGVLSRPFGYNYGPLWQHPLTPYRFMGEGKAPLSIKGQANSAAYSNWLGIVYGEPRKKNGKPVNGVSPALCCTRSEAKKVARKMKQGISAAGYNMSNAKAVSWCEHVFPIIDVEEERRSGFTSVVYDMVQAADQVRRNLYGGLKEALILEAGKNQVSAGSTLFENAANEFWHATEEAFYKYAEQLASLECESDTWQSVLFEWGKHLHLEAEMIFDALVWTDGFPVERMGQRVEAQGKMRAYIVKSLRDMAMYQPKEG
ncbi:MAG: type I-E CRISPR-associated protein Cse1/CasA [bacterium]|nr:type I-E CRISPR-associated protein Cse1/CasA [bacterium]